MLCSGCSVGEHCWSPSSNWKPHVDVCALLIWTANTALKSVPFYFTVFNKQAWRASLHLLGKMTEEHFWISRKEKFHGPLLILFIWVKMQKILSSGSCSSSPSKCLSVLPEGSLQRWSQDQWWASKQPGGLFQLKGRKPGAERCFLHGFSAPKHQWKTRQKCVCTGWAPSGASHDHCLKWFANMVFFSLIRDRPGALDCLSHRWFMVSWSWFLTTISLFFLIGRDS